MEKNLQNNAALEKFKDIAEAVNICMMITPKGENNCSTRPMATIHVDDTADVWFFTSRVSEKVQLISLNPKVQLVYSHPAKDSYMDVRGNAVVVLDRDKIKELWNPIVKVWFPEGTDDPDLCLVRISPEQVFYWSNTSLNE